MTYKIGDLIEYGDGSPGIITKIYWDGSVAIIDPYTLDDGEDEYHVIERDDIIGRIYTIPPITQGIINRFESVMPIEFWAIASLIVGTIFGILKGVIK